MATHNIIINFGRTWNAKVLSRCTQISVRLFNRTCLASTIDERRKLSSQAGEEISSGNVMKGKIDLMNFSAKKIRNFSIIAHVDHGKSTLADRLLELTGTISDRGNNKQVLDKLQVERERGITVKAQASSMFFKSKGETYLLNLIDTPGHVDFSYEVSRSLAACQGVVLLVDAAQGVQAQTLANYFLARDAGLHIIPVLNKIDLKTADPDKVSQQMTSLFDIDKNEILQVSAKTGQGVKAVIQAIIEEMPSPADEVNGPLKALIFDSWYDQYKGVVCLTAVVSGAVKKGEEIMSSHSKQSYEVMDVGIMYPSPLSTGALYAGQVGYLEMGMRNRKETQIGDTFYHPSCPVDPLPGFQPMRPMVFAGVFPVDQSEFVYLRSAIDKLTLNDSSVTVHPENCTALGQGWRLGFLGLLHMDVFKQRLEQEYDASVIVTSPSVPYKAILRGNQKPEIDVLNPLELPDPSKAEQYLEPFVVGTLIFPEEYMGKMITLCEGRRGEQLDVVYIDESRIMVKYRLPLSEIILDFYDEIKSQSSGYASFDYEDCGYRPTQVVKMDILINGNAVDALSSIVHIDKAQVAGRHLCSKLKEVIPRQLFEIVIQASVRGRIIARETLRALGKDVTAKCYGGDMSRKMKLIKRQKEGKKKMKRIGKVDIPHKAFLALLKR